MNKINIANAPCSWGVLEFNLEGESSDYNNVLHEMHHAGYAGTEFGDWGFLPTHPDKLIDTLSKHQLTLLAAFIPVALAKTESVHTGLEHALRTARLLQKINPLSFIVLADENATVDFRTHNAGRIQPDHMLTPNQWKTFGTNANLVAQSVFDQTGLKTVFHHHCAGFVETPDEVDILLHQTNPDILGLCFDTGHYAFAGGNALDGVKRFRDRIWHVHFKDCSTQIASLSTQNQWDYFESVKHGVFCELGKGSVDFPAVKDYLLNTGYRGWIVVEQDVLPGMGSPFESAKRNREYLQSIGL